MKEPMTTKSRITAPPSAESRAMMKELLAYDPETGQFTWLKQRAHIRAGARAGTWAKDGYWRIGINHREHYAHHIAWFFMTGAWSTLEIDHINSDPADNRWCNLRQATTSQNHHNRRRTTTRSRFKGVTPSKGKWVASLHRKYLGYFNTEEEAARAYDRAALQRDPVFARINFPRSDYEITDAGRAALEQGS